MKKIVVTSVVALSLATVSGIGIGLAVNRPVILNPKNLSSVEGTPATASPAPQHTAPTTQVAEPVSQPNAITTAPASSTTVAATTQTPITITAYRQIPLDANGNVDCEYTYSDSTTHQWHWQTINPQGTWVTDGQGENGHWQATTVTSGTCDNTIIGKTIN